MALLTRGVAGWRITVRATADRAATLDALVRTGRVCAPTRTGWRRRSSSAGCRGSSPACRWRWRRWRRRSTRSPPVRLTWSSATGAPTRWAGCATDRPPGARRAHRAAGGDGDRRRPHRPRPGPCSPPGSPRPIGSGASRPRYTWAPGRDEAPPVPTRRLSAEWQDERWTAATAEEDLGGVDPDLAGILERSLADQPPRVAEIERLFRARGHEVEAVARSRRSLRRRRMRHGHLRRQSGTSTT